MNAPKHDALHTAHQVLALIGAARAMVEEDGADPADIAMVLGMARNMQDALIDRIDRMQIDARKSHADVDEA